MFQVYIIESLSTKKWYYGHTNDLKRRLLEHNAGKNISTKQRGPWNYVFNGPVSTLTEAVEFEKYLKRTRNKDYIKSKYFQYFISYTSPGTFQLKRKYLA